MRFAIMLVVWYVQVSVHLPHHLPSLFSSSLKPSQKPTTNTFLPPPTKQDLCRAALYFSYATLKVGGHFVCKFYQGAEDKALENSLRAMFAKVHREKPESSRAQSKEAYFVCIRRLARIDRGKVFAE
jgi:hypothetical protein